MARELGMNFIVGMRKRSGVFFEMRATALGVSNIGLLAGFGLLNGLARGRSYAESCLHGFDITYLLRSKLRDQVATRPKVDPSVSPKMPMKRTPCHLIHVEGEVMDL